MTDRSARRLYWIYPPRQGHEQIGSGATLVAAMVLIVGPALVVSTAWGTGGLITALAGTVAALVILSAFTGWQFDRRHGARLRRLRGLATEPAARQRLPHRIAELALLRKSEDYTTALAAMPPGSALVIRAPNALRFGVHTALPFAFEPVVLSDMAALGRLASPDAGDVLPHRPRRTPRRLRRGAVRLRGVSSGLLLALLLIPIIGGMLLARQIFGGEIPIWFMLIVWAVVIALPFVLVRWVFNQGWWLVPGGILFAQWPLWRRRRQAVWWPAARVPLIMICDNRRVPREAPQVRLPDAKQHAATVTVSAAVVLRAWISAQGVPDAEAVTEFLGGDVDLQVRGDEVTESAQSA